MTWHPLTYADLPRFFCDGDIFRIRDDRWEEHTAVYSSLPTPGFELADGWPVEAYEYRDATTEERADFEEAVGERVAAELGRELRRAS